jgi:hypothetical protein
VTQLPYEEITFNVNDKLLILTTGELLIFNSKTSCHYFFTKHDIPVISLAIPRYGMVATVILLVSKHKIFARYLDYENFKAFYILTDKNANTAHFKTYQPY